MLWGDEGGSGFGLQLTKLTARPRANKSGNPLPDSLQPRCSRRVHSNCATGFLGMSTDAHLVASFRFPLHGTYQKICSDVTNLPFPSFSISDSDFLNF